MRASGSDRSASPVAGSRLRARIASGRPVWMVNPGGAAFDVIDMLGRIGVPCVFIDCERTAVGIESVAPLARCAQRHGMAAVVRSESARPEILVRYLDRDIDGIVVPHVESADEARAIVDVVQYATRGVPDRVFTIAQIESAAAVERVGELAEVTGIDGYLIGPNDLAHSMGHAGDTSRAEVQRAVEHVGRILQAGRRVWGLPATTHTRERWVEAGARLLYLPLEAIVSGGWAACQERS